MVNIVMPAINGYFYGNVHENPKPTRSDYYCYAFSVFIDCALLCVSGCMLIFAVGKIRTTLKDKQQYINVRQLMLHATSFALYMLAFFGQRIVLIILISEC